MSVKTCPRCGSSVIPNRAGKVWFCLGCSHTDETVERDQKEIESLVHRRKEPSHREKKI